ncbi:hypothetical protein THAOC_32045 [Thalassiosira oceanica]|uniref:Uncharacterized protein n=1 Tax=Thalassiosira oceanica TaxID=159749 RepID=K0R806_THAOC|nr:hypothetical protein THAOC_32045 [Thalassiosira oceanica]|eukprot:EJK49110.1 hypothetical protein THAOC_32045 [Thalassiosira oceanica]
MIARLGLFGENARCYARRILDARRFCQNRDHDDDAAPMSAKAATPWKCNSIWTGVCNLLLYYQYHHFGTSSPDIYRSVEFGDLRKVAARSIIARSPTPFRPIMDRLTGIERPYEPSSTSHGTRVKAGATRPAPGGLWEPHNAYRSRNLKQIQVNHEPSEGGHGCSAPD